MTGRVRVPRDLVPTEASAVIGGPLGVLVGRRARSLRQLLPVIVAVVTVPMALAVLRQGHCVAKGWNGSEQFWRGCYSDLPSQYQLGGLGGGLGSWWSGEPSGQQLPLLSGLMALVGGLVPGGDWLSESRWYVGLWAVLLTIAAAVGVWCVGRLRPHRLDLATQLALSPIYVVAALLSADLLVVALVLGALLAFAQSRPALAGVLLGLGVLGHAWVAIAAVALLLSADRRGRWPEAARTVLVAGGVVVAVLAALLLLRPELALAPLRRWWGEAAGYGALARVPELLGHPMATWSLNVLALLGWVVGVLVAAALARSAWRPASWAQLAAVALVPMLLLGKTLPVQAALWVLPLAIAAGISWRAHLGFVAVEALHAFALWMHLGFADDPDKGLPPAWYAVVVLARTLAWGVLLWSIWCTPDDNPPTRRAGDVAPQEPVARPQPV